MMVDSLDKKNVYLSRDDVADHIGTKTGKG